MSIANELSCDVAAAMLAHKDAPQSETSNRNLTEIVFEFHSTLRQLTGEARQRRRRSQILPSPAPSSSTNLSGTNNSNAASGNH
jgi:hypothetical protein